MVTFFMFLYKMSLTNFQCVGKTLVAKAIATETQRSFISVKGDQYILIYYLYDWIINISTFINF